MNEKNLEFIEKTLLKIVDEVSLVKQRESIALRERTENRERLVQIAKKTEEIEINLKSFRKEIYKKLGEHKGKTWASIALVATGAAIASGQLKWDKIVEKLLHAFK